MGQKVKKQVKCADAEACVHCHLCRNHCAFLGKYGIDIGDTEAAERACLSLLSVREVYGSLSERN